MNAVNGITCMIKHAISEIQVKNCTVMNCRKSQNTPSSFWRPKAERMFPSFFLWRREIFWSLRQKCQHCNNKPLTNKWDLPRISGDHKKYCLHSYLLKQILNDPFLLLFSRWHFNASLWQLHTLRNNNKSSPDNVWKNMEVTYLDHTSIKNILVIKSTNLSGTTGSSENIKRMFLFHSLWTKIQYLIMPLSNTKT